MTGWEKEPLEMERQGQKMLMGGAWKGEILSVERREWVIQRKAR